MTSLSCRQTKKREDPYIRIKTIFYNYFPEVELQDVLKNGNFTFPMCLTSKQRKRDLSMLDIELSIRSYNALYRAGFHSIGDLCDGIETSRDLGNIRGMGKHSQRNVMCALFIYQFNCLNSNQREAYLRKVIELSLESERNKFPGL